MRKRYRRRVPTVEAEQFRPDLGSMLPEGVEKSLTPGKYWLRSVQHGRMNRHDVGAVPVEPFDYIVSIGKEKVVMSPEEFKLAYEEV